MTNPSRRRLGAATAFALLAAASTSAAAPADPAQGERLAKRWCAACHIVAADQTRGADNVPAFAAISEMPGFSAQNIAQFLMDPHPKMPDMQLTRDEARDLGAYIASLAR
jgi:mono/diheme cytochrome c family protein